MKKSVDAFVNKVEGLFNMESMGNNCFAPAHWKILVDEREKIHTYFVS
jgi:hypothetical protein